MIIVQDYFVCRPGFASKVAKTIKEAMVDDPNLIYVMTDMTGRFHRVIMVSKYDSLADWEKLMASYMNPPKEMKEAMEKMRGIQEMYWEGGREIYRVW